MAALSRRAAIGLGAIALAWAAVAIAVGVHKRGDFPPELAQADRLLSGLPLYEHNPPLGVWWPPFTAAAFVPFALIARWSDPLALALWAALGAACVIWSVITLGRRYGWTPALLGFLAVAAPIQNSFELLQITTVLLGLVVASIVALEDRRATGAGVWMGLATAAKAFPGLLLVWALLRRNWRTAIAGFAAAGVVTVGAMLPYGPLGAVRAVWDWLALNREATGVGGLHMQKLARLGYGWGAPWSVIVALQVALIVVLVAALARRRPPFDPLAEVGMVTIVAVLLSPVGWYYYFGLLLPAWVAALRVSGSTGRNVVLGLAALLLTGWLGKLHLPAALSVLVSDSDTKAGLLLLGVLALQPAHPSPSRPETA